MTRPASDLEPGSFALTSRHRCTAEGLFRFPDGTGWYVSLDDSGRLPNDYSLGRVTGRWGPLHGWAWDPNAQLSGSVIREVVATGLVPRDFESVDALRAALTRARPAEPAPRAVKVGDTIRGRDQPCGSLVERLTRPTDSPWRYRVRLSHGRSWNIGADRAHVDRRQLHDGAPAAWNWPPGDGSDHVRVLALDVPDEAWRDPARVDAMLSRPAPQVDPRAAVKVGDRDLRGKDLPGGCVVREVGGRLAHVKSTRAYAWLDGRPAQREVVDDNVIARWEVLALNVPDDATPEQARQAAGLEPRPQAAQAPAWAAGDRGALLAFPGDDIVLWWHEAAADGSRWAFLDNGEGPAKPSRKAPWSDPDRPATEALLRGADVLLDGLDADEVARIALLRPTTRRAAESIAGMTAHLRGKPGASPLERQPSGWAILAGAMHSGIAHGCAFAWEDSTLSNGAALWERETRWKSVVIDELREEQARAFLRTRPNAQRDYAIAAARWWHHATPDERRTPPPEHAWAAAGAAPVLPSLGKVEVCDPAGLPAGTLAYDGAGSLWLGTPGGGACLSAGRPGSLVGWPGDEAVLRADANGPGAWRSDVLARDLAPEEQAMLLVVAQRRRIAGAPFDAAACAAMLEAARKSWAEAKGSPETAARLRGHLLCDLAGEPWREGWATRQAALPAPEAAGRCAEAFVRARSGAVHLRELQICGLDYRYVAHVEGRSLRFGAWRGVPFMLQSDAAPSREEVLRAAVVRALEAPTLPPAERVEAARRLADAQVDVLPGAQVIGPLKSRQGWRCPKLEDLGCSALWDAISLDLLRAGLPADNAGAYPYLLNPAQGDTVEINVGGLARIDGKRPTLLVIVGCARDEDVSRACRAVLPRLLREARRHRARPGIAVLGPTIRGRAL